LQTEPYSQWQNLAELLIRELKKAVRRIMFNTMTPKKLWDECMQFVAEIVSHTPNNSPEMRGRIPQTLVTSETPDISRIAEFPWFAWIWWHDQMAAFPDPRQTLGRYLGPGRDVGSVMTAKILKSNGQTIVRSSYIAVKPDEFHEPRVKKAMEDFMKDMEVKVGRPLTKDDLPEDETPRSVPYEDWDDEEALVMPERDDYDISTYDPYMHADVILPHQGAEMKARVSFRKRDSEGNLIGQSAGNPVMDHTRQCIVQFEDGSEAEYSANIIAQNLINQVDAEGNRKPLMRNITGHRRTKDAVQRVDGYVEVAGKRAPKRTTKGWNMCMEWADGSTSWVLLALIKEQCPVEVAEYAILHSLDKEPAFTWWVKWTLEKRDHIIAAVNTRYWKCTHKFGIRIPHSVPEAYAIDKEAGNTKWADAIAKEMKNVRIAFEMSEPGVTRLPGHQHIKCHIVFDIKMDTLAYKARMVAGGHMTETPASMTYASVVSRESVRCALTLAALNDLQVKAGDISRMLISRPLVKKGSPASVVQSLVKMLGRQQNWSGLSTD
jgi:hypothetical protein